MNKSETIGECQEVWKDIQGYEEFYQVSNTGKIRSKDRLVTTNKNGKSFLKKGRVMKPISLGKGYEGVILCKPNTPNKKVYIHRMVADAFLFKTDENSNVVNHIDGNKKNNNSSNLEWTTHRENLKHAKELGLNKMNGTDHPLSKFDNDIVFKARELYSTGNYKQSELADMFGVSRMQMHRYVKNKTKHYRVE